MKVLLSCVGRNDPVSEETNEEGAILTSVRKLRPDYVILFPTQEHPAGVWSSTWDNAKMAQEFLCDPEFKEIGVKNCTLYPLCLEDPRDYREILRQLRDHIDRILRGEDFRLSEIFVNLSSGTPQMEACWLVLGNAGYLPNARFYQVARPSLTQRTIDERVSGVDISFLEEDLLIEGFRRDIELGAYELAERNMRKLAKITTYLDRKALFEVLTELMEAYASWDRLDYVKARDRIGKTLRTIQRFPNLSSLRSLVQEQLQVAGSLAAATTEDFFILTDIYHNAVRKFNRAAYADSTARSWRLVEGVYYYRLRQLGVDPFEPGNSRDEQVLEFMKERRYRLDRPLLFYEAQDVLHNFDKDWLFSLRNTQLGEIQLDVPVGKSSVNNAMCKIREIRNKSIVAHGTASVDHRQAAVSLALAKTCLCYAFKGKKQEIEQYPFSYHKVYETVTGVI